MKKILSVILAGLLASCAAQDDTRSGYDYVISGLITREQAIQLEIGVRTGKIRHIEFRDSPGGAWGFLSTYNPNTKSFDFVFPLADALRSSQVTGTITGKCISACASIATNVPVLKIASTGQLCLHGATFEGYLVYFPNFYFGMYQNLTQELYAKLIKSFPESYCMTREELNSIGLSG